jgi:hypothetical protein
MANSDEAQVLAVLTGEALQEVEGRCQRHDFAVACSKRLDAAAEWLLDHGVTLGGKPTDQKGA